MGLNKIITRGLGSSRGKSGRASLVTMGFGGIFEAIVAGTERLIKVGQSGMKRALKELDEIIVWAKMIRVNDEAPKKTIEGFVKVHVKDLSQTKIHVTQPMSRSVLDKIKIAVKHLK